MLSGLLFAFLGAILPAWGYHIHGRPVTVGNYFLSVNLGIIGGVLLAQRILERRNPRGILVAGCAVAFASFLYLAFVPPPSLVWWRMFGLFGLGCGGGLLNSGLFHGIAGVYEHDAAGTVNLSGMFFGIGCLATALLAAGTFYAYTVTGIVLFFALIPGVLAVVFYRAKVPDAPARRQPSVRETLRDVQSPAAVMFALVVFLQFGNEYALAGWLTLFLIQQLGISPEAALLLLGLYWFCLLVGRAGAQLILAHIRHTGLLLMGASAAMFGCLVLFTTNNRFGAGTGVVMAGLGFAVILPLVLEQISGRFPSYHPGFFNGIFSLALTGGMLAPWSLGLLVDYWNIRAVMLLPLAGTMAVLILLALIRLEAVLTGPRAAKTSAG